MWIDVGRSRRPKISEDRLEDDPVRDRNDSRLGVPEGELSDDKSINIDLESGDELNGSIG